MCFCFLDSSNLSLMNYMLYIHIPIDDDEEIINYLI
jgi:hypothetical protein